MFSSGFPCAFSVWGYTITFPSLGVLLMGPEASPACVIHSLSPRLVVSPLRAESRSELFLGSSTQHGACDPWGLTSRPSPCWPQLLGWPRYHELELALLPHRWHGLRWGWVLNQSIWLLVSSFLFLAGPRLGNSGCLSGAVRAPGQSMLCRALSALQQAPVLLLT